MNEIKELLIKLIEAAKADTTLVVHGNQLARIVMADHHATPETAKELEEAFENVRTAVRQDQLQGVKLATPDDVSEAIGELRRQAYCRGRNASGKLVVFPDVTDASLDAAERHLRVLIGPREPVPELIIGRDLGLLFEQAGAAYRACEQDQISLEWDDPYRQERYQTYTQLIASITRQMVKSVPELTVVVQGREIPVAPGFDDLLNQMLGAVRGMICAEIQYGDNVDPDQTLERSRKRFYATRDAVRCRYLGLDDEPGVEIEQLIQVALNAAWNAGNAIAHGSSNLKELVSHKDQAALALRTAVARLRRQLAKEIEPCLVVVLNRVIKAAKEVGLMHNQPGSGAPAQERLNQAINEFHDTVRMLSEQGPTEAQLNDLKTAIDQLLLSARGAAVASIYTRSAAQNQEAEARAQLMALFQVIPCVPRPQQDQFVRDLLLHTAGLMVELDELMASTKDYRSMMKGTLPDGIVSIKSLRGIRHYQLEIEPLLKKISID